MKKSTSILVFIILFVSLMVNSYQHAVINSYKEKQHFNDVKLIAAVGQLNFYLNKVNFESISEKDIRACLSMSKEMFTLVWNSTYSTNSDVLTCFNDLDNVFAGLPVQNIKDNGEQMKVLLKTIIDKDSNKINPNECKKLSEYIRNTMLLK